MQSIYEKIGGEATIHKLVDAFYRRVQAHALLQPIFPSDLTETRQKQFLFLSQFFGGPPLYTAKRGHPMLRARHLLFFIDGQTADAWLTCMAAALDEVGIEPKAREEMWGRFQMTAYHMINKDN